MKYYLLFLFSFLLFGCISIDQSDSTVTGVPNQSSQLQNESALHVEPIPQERNQNETAISFPPASETNPTNQTPISSSSTGVASQMIQLFPDLNHPYVGAINIAAVIDDSSEYNQPDSYFYNLLQNANRSFTGLTGISFNVINLVHLASNQNSHPAEPSTNSTSSLTQNQTPSSSSSIDLAKVYLARYPAPEYLIIFTRNDLSAISKGGRGGGINGSSLPADFTCNRLHTMYGSRSIVLNYADATHKAFICGYNSTRFKPGGWNTPPTSKVSIDGQCHNSLGIPCVVEGGASRCSNWRQVSGVNNTVLITDLDNQLVQMIIVHELGHSFAPSNYEHFGARDCIVRTRATINWSNIDIQNSATNFFGLCPDIFPRFARNYASCS